ncbi:hypothetical protein ACRRTK_011043 [Alexandromys fortis]
MPSHIGVFVPLVNSEPRRAPWAEESTEETLSEAFERPESPFSFGSHSSSWEEPAPDFSSEFQVLLECKAENKLPKAMGSVPLSAALWADLLEDPLDDLCKPPSKINRLQKSIWLVKSSYVPFTSINRPSPTSIPAFKIPFRLGRLAGALQGWGLADQFIAAVNRYERRQLSGRELRPDRFLNSTKSSCCSQLLTNARCFQEGRELGVEGKLMMSVVVSSPQADIHEDFPQSLLLQPGALCT